jgi:hypothetical protein
MALRVSVKSCIFRARKPDVAAAAAMSYKVKYSIQKYLTFLLSISF